MPNTPDTDPAARPVLLTARQLSLVTQLLQALGVLLVAKGVISSQDLSLTLGIIVSVGAVFLGWKDGGNNDHNTATVQTLLGAIPDAKPSTQTISKAINFVIDLAKKPQ
jgi:hypothetical protein